MKTDELIMVSIDDHVVEPPDMFERRVPAKWADQAPRVVVGDSGVDQWVYRGRPTGVSGLNAVVSWPAEEWGRDPAGFDEMRPGVVSIPHGFGHHRDQVGWRLAAEKAGASVNDITDPARVDRLSGNAAFNAVPVRVESAIRH